MMRAWIVLAVLPLLAQEEPVFRSQSTLAIVPFHVVRAKKYVDDLKPQDLILLEDGVPREISFFEGGRNSQQRTTPVEIALLFDISGSVVDEGLLDMTMWKSAFLDSLPDASLAVYGFDARLLRFTSPTRDNRQLEAAFNSVLKTSRSGPKVQPVSIQLKLPPKRKSATRGGTWIYEAVVGAVEDMTSRAAKATRLIVIFSDGFPTTNSVPEDAAKVAQDAGIALYPVALGHWRIVEQVKQIAPLLTDSRPNGGAQGRMDNLRMKEQEILDFASLGELTGGRSFDPPMMNSEMLRRIAGMVVGSVISEYVVGFTPPLAEGKPGKHKLVVKLASKETGKLLGGTRTVVH